VQHNPCWSRVLRFVKRLQRFTNNCALLLSDRVACQQNPTSLSRIHRPLAADNENFDGLAVWVGVAVKLEGQFEVDLVGFDLL